MFQGQHKNASLRLGGADYTPIEVSKVGNIKEYADVFYALAAIHGFAASGQQRSLTGKSEPLTGCQAHLHLRACQCR